MSNLLTLERMVIESLSRNKRGVKELSIDTGLSHSVLTNILPNLVMNNIVCYKQGEYLLNRENKNQWLTQLRDRKSIQGEVQDLLSSMINEFFSNENSPDNFKLQKIYVTKQDEQVLNTLIGNMDNFVSELRVKNKNRCEFLKEKRVVFWGQSSYENLINGILKSA